MKKTALKEKSTNPQIYLNKKSRLLENIKRIKLMNLSEIDQKLFIEYGLGDEILPDFENVLDAFEYWVSKTPHNIAAEYKTKNITYKELDNEATILALILKQKGIKNGDVIGLYIPRSIDLIISIIACIKLEVTYVPQDPRIVPIDMLEKISTKSEQNIILSLSTYAEKISFYEKNKIILIDKEINKKIYRNLYGNIKLINHQNKKTDSTCFILFTSGTTGTPNGVQVSHKNLCNILYSAPGNLGIAPGVKVAQILNISFDMAAWEILGCLGNGGTLLIRGKDILETVTKANVIIATPTILTTVPPEKCKEIKSVAVAGEPCPVMLAERWSKLCNFYNSCGPTETTIVNTMKKCIPGSSELSIGKPTPNNTVYILNKDMTPTKIGEIGIMWGGGDCVSKGYLHDESLTRKKYKLDPFLNDGSHMFNTGDLGKWNKNGELIHFGRIDDQVKIKGFRVELDSISKIIESFNDVKRAATIKYQDYLVAFVSTNNQTENLLELLKKQLQKELPYYYTPSNFIFLEELPKTSRGKIDKRALKQTLIL
ncbi:AMP-binding protein [Tenacibaculum sp. C7A-26P2]|uniref:AMP-binding protein n=1 Tax=Tenacibaculum sp. C7A-26P2 TaxID=3447504 RepID=UPI003F854504